MPKLTDKQLAELIREMPDASNEEIAREAKRRELESYSDLERTVLGEKPKQERSTLGKLYDKATTPLTTKPSEIATDVANSIDQRSLAETPWMARLKGFAAGATEGVGNILTQMTSPLDLALTLVSGGGVTAGKRGLLGISKAARQAEAALSAPFVAAGASEAVQGAQEGDMARVGAGAVQAVLGGAGMKSAGTHSFPPKKVTEAYMKSKGRTLVEAPQQQKLDPDFSKRTADAYEAMEHSPNDPRVAASYKAMSDETSDQFAFLRDQAGVQMIPWTKEGQPYANSAEMMADIKKNNRLFYFPTEAGYGSGADVAVHPLLAPGKSGVPVNDEFRAAHDYFGHAVEGNQFGPLGEERAYQAHRRMFPAEAVGALTSETRGQNSWVNSGRHLRRDDGSIPLKGEEGFVPPQDRPFADQKAGLLPEEFQVAVPQSPGAMSSTSPSASFPSTGIQAASPSGKLYTPDEAAVNVAELHNQHEGSTFNVAKGSLSGTPHYAVSVYKGREKKVPGAQLTPEVVKDYIAKNQDLLSDPKNSIGTWFNKGDGQSYLDISVTTDNLDEALALGQQNKQLAIFDLQKFEEIPVANQPDMPVGSQGDIPLARQVEGLPPEFHSVHPDGTAFKQSPQRPQTPDVVDRIVEKLPTDQPLGSGANAKLAEQLQKVEEAKRASGGGSTALALAAPGAAMAIPDDPDSNWDEWGRIGLSLAGAAGLGMALQRKAPLSGQKLHANRGAALMLAGKKPQEIMAHLAEQGVAPEAMPKVMQAASKILDKEIQKVGKKLTSTNKLLQMFDTGRAEMGWYDQSAKELKEMFGKDAELVAGFLTATSVNATIKSNATLGLKAYRQWKAGEPFEGFLPAVKKELNRVANGEPLSGRKLDNFRKALIGDPDAVVVDRWMLRAFGVKGNGATQAQYDLIEDAVRQMAKDKGVTPRQMQAAIWYGIKSQMEAGKSRPSSPTFTGAINERINKDHAQALKENKKFDTARRNPNLF
jgi:hypothetical protein